MTDQKQSSPDQKDPSLTAERRRRMREAAEAAALEAPGEWHTGDDGLEGNYQGLHQVIAGRGRLTGDDWAVLLTINPNYPVEPISRYVVETQPPAVLALLDALEQIGAVARMELGEQLARALDEDRGGVELHLATGALVRILLAEDGRYDVQASRRGARATSISVGAELLHGTVLHLVGALS